MEKCWKLGIFYFILYFSKVMINQSFWIYRELRDGNWVEVILHPSDGGEVLVSQHTDPREVYMEKIFQPKRFNLYDIHKALNVSCYFFIFRI